MTMTSQSEAAQQLVPWKASKLHSIEKFRLLSTLLKTAGKDSVSGHFMAFVPSSV